MIRIEDYASHKSLEEIKAKLEEKKERIRNLRIRGFIGKQKWSLERLKSFSFSLLDRLLTEDLEFNNIKDVLLFLEDIEKERKELEKIYTHSQKPYPKRVKNQLKGIKAETRISQTRGSVYLSSKARTKLNEIRRMPLIQYLQSKIRAQQLLFYALSGLLLVRRYLVGVIHTRYHKRDRRFMRGLKENEKIETRVRELKHQLIKEKQILAVLVKMEKKSENDTFTIKEDEWREEEF